MDHFTMEGKSPWWLTIHHETLKYQNTWLFNPTFAGIDHYKWLELRKQITEDSSTEKPPSWLIYLCSLQNQINQDDPESQPFCDMDYHYRCYKGWWFYYMTPRGSTDIDHPSMADFNNLVGVIPIWKD